MRKFTLFAFAFIVVSIANAQITKGSLLLGGDIGVRFGKSESGTPVSSTEKTSYVQFSPSLGIAIRENTIAGVGLIYGHNTIKREGTYKRNINTYGADVFLRKYLNLGKSFYFFGESSVYFTIGKDKERSTPALPADHISKFTNIGLTFKPGVSYAINRRLHIEAALPNLININYQNQKNGYAGFPANSNETSSFSVNSSLSGLSNLAVGLRFLIAK